MLKSPVVEPYVAKAIFACGGSKGSHERTVLDLRDAGFVDGKGLSRRQSKEPCAVVKTKVVDIMCVCL